MAEIKQLVRIANTDIDGRKALGYALTKIKGIGERFAHALCAVAGISKHKKAGELSDKEIEQLDKIIANPVMYGMPSWMINRPRNLETGNPEHLILGELDFAVDNDLKRMKRLKMYRGIRHMFGLPVRGQRTKSNFRKNKGKVLGVKRKAKAKSGRV